ncbi:MAG: ribonuclease Y [Planctomycetaceae bacterium]|jgi:ribonuclease Y|nr:ribonuclease Y [Planctomycetaceae bacterium]
MEYSQLITPAIIAVTSVILTIIIIRLLDTFSRSGAEQSAKNVIRRAENEAENKIREAEILGKEKAFRLKENTEKEFDSQRKKLHERERLLDKRQDLLDKQAEDQRKQEKIVENTQLKLTERLAEADRKSRDLDKLIEKERVLLHEAAGLSREEAKEKLLALLDRELQVESGTMIMRHEKQIKENCETMTRNILLSALQRYASPHTVETTTASVDIPNDEMKGRIIGREGRNIRSFEKASGTDLLVDDTPGIVVVSCFDPIRREISRLALTRLIADGRIHPARIEEVISKTTDEVHAFVLKNGKEAAQEVGIFDLDDRLIELLGRLHYRTSYSQNVLKHSIEVAFISGAIAAQIGLNEKLARRCGLLHDVGKAADHESEGGHPKIGADFLKRFGEPADVVNAALGHHEDARIENPYTMIVAAADACSASRPGARRESLDLYNKRMDELESLAVAFAGVEQAFAIQAGREVRVMVNSSQQTDESAAKICRDIARLLTEKIQFPGEIKVTVIRETRFVETAK